MREQLPAIIIATPLFVALMVIIASWVRQRWCVFLAFMALLISTAAGAGMLLHVWNGSPIDYHMAGWPPPIGIAYRIDFLNAPLLFLIPLLALINLCALHGSTTDYFEEKSGVYYSLYLLFIAGLIGMVITADAFNLYVLLEIASLTGYALIGMGRRRAPLAALHYLFMGSIGASFYLLGVGYLYLSTGTLNMADLAVRLSSLTDSPIVGFAFVFCLIGLGIKMAFFPLHGWLPNAYSMVPPPVSAPIAGLTTKVMLYVLIRISFSVFGYDYLFNTLSLSSIMVSAAILAIIAGSLMAYRQNSLRRMLAYLVVVEVGYMMGGFWLGSEAALQGTILHLLNDAVMTMCVFLTAGIMEKSLGDDSFFTLRGAFRAMPFTSAAFLVGALSIIGVPPTSGFFSKWYLLQGAIQAGRYDFAAILVASSLFNLFLFFRLFEYFHFEPQHASSDKADSPHTAHGPAAVPWSEAAVPAVISALAVALLIVLMGLVSGDIISHFIQPAVMVFRG